MLTKQTSVYVGGFFAAVLVAVVPMIVAPEHLYPLIVVCGFGLCACVLIYLGADQQEYLQHTNKALYPDLRAAANNAIKHLFDGGERSKAVSFLQSGHIVAWSRIKGHERSDLIPLGSDEWKKYRLEMIEIGGITQTIMPRMGMAIRISRPWAQDGGEVNLTRLYDVHFNRAQLKAIWPDIDF